MMKDITLNPYAYIKEGEKPTGDAWLQFALTTFLTLGIGLFLTGIIFFFAYNWVELHHIAKMGIISASIIASCIGAIYCKKKVLVKQILLLVASVMVGVLLAVYGQVYQLQSNSGFLAWAIFMVLWVIVADFDVLWLIFITVLQIGVAFAITGKGMVAHIVVFPVINFIFLAFVGIFAIVPHYIKAIRERSRWFVIVLFTASAISTITTMIIFYRDGFNALFFFMFLAVALYYGWQKRDLSIMTLAFLVVVIEIHIITIEAILFLGTFTIIGSIACYVWFIKKLKQMWGIPKKTTNTIENGDTEQ